MLEERIYNLLTNDTAITNIVGEKVYWVRADETVREPYIVLNFIDGIRDYTLTDVLDLAEARIQISVWDNSLYDAINLQKAVLTCLDNFSDRDNPSLYNPADTYISWIKTEPIGELYDKSAGQNNSEKYGRGIDFKISYKI